MTIGMILLSQDGFYLDAMGELPSGRPSWDKQFLLDVCTDKRILCSNNTAIDLPSTLTDVITCLNTDDSIEHDVNLGVDTLGAEDLLFVTRTQHDIGQGKLFRLEDYTQILKQGDFEIWKSNLLKKQINPNVKSAK